MNRLQTRFRFFVATVISVSALFLFATTATVAYAVDELSVTASTTGTDNLIGATNAKWVFTATTTSNIATGTVVQLIFPNITQGAMPFTITGATISATSSNMTGSDIFGIFNLYANPYAPVPGVVAAQSPNGPVVFGYATSTIPAGRTFSVTIGGIANATGQISLLQNLSFSIKAGTPLDPAHPEGDLSSTVFNSENLTVTRSLARAGGALVSDNNSSITATSYSTSTATSFTFAITTTTAIPIGGKIGINLPSEFSLQNATTTVLAQSISNNTAAKVANGAIATTTGQGINRVVLTTSVAVVNAGDVLTVTVGGLMNPATAAVYRPFSLFTMKANSGLLDGSYSGFESTDFGSGAPPPQDTVHVGGLNKIIIQVQKQSGGSTVALSGSELTQVKVGAGCPDKQFFIGERWLDANAIATYDHVLDCNYMLGVSPFSGSNQSFFSSFLPPGFKNLNVVSSGGTGQTSTTTLVFGIPNATTTLKLTGGVAGQNAFINSFSSDNQSFSDVFTDATYTTAGFAGNGDGFARIPINSGKDWSFNVEGGMMGSNANFQNGAGAKLWPPVIPSIRLTGASTTDINMGTFPYVMADKNLVVTLTKSGASGNITDACIGVMRSGGGIFMGPQDMVCQSNYDSDANSSLDSYRFKVPSGTVTVQINRGGFGPPVEYPVAISAATTTKSVALSSPTSYIVVAVETSGGTAINGAPVFAHGSNGFGNAMTSTTGTTTLYVPPGTYTVEGFAPAFGSLTAQSVTVTDVSNPSITFTVNTGTLKTISGTVTQGGTGVSGFSVGAHGTGATSGGNGTQTDADGNYILYVPAGTYEVGGWSQNTGGLAPLTANVSSSNASGIDWSLGVQGTLHVEVQNSSNISPLFAGAFDSTTGRGNGTDSWSASSTSKVANITLPAGTYNVQAGSPSLGGFGSQTGVVITGGATTNVTFNAASSGTLVTLSGAVTASAVGVSGVNVWASRVDGPGFFSAQTDSSGNYSIKVPDALTYHVGARSLAYITDQGDVSVAVSGNTVQDFTLTSAGSTITGKVKNSGGTGIASAWVTAFKTSGTTTQTGSPTDASGDYSLNVDAASTWNIFAEGPCYLRASGISGTAGDTSKDITLATQSGCTVPTPELHAITDSSGGQISQSDMTLDIPANALGTTQNSVSVSVSNAANVVSSANATPMKSSVKTITASDSSGQSITSLNNNASLSITYDPTELPNGFDESNIQLAYFDTNTGQWEPVAATVDTTNNTLTAQVSHFTDYGPILPGVPDAPTGLSATAVSSSQINLSWTASPAATSNTIYRSLTDSNFTTSIATGLSGTSYSDNVGLSEATTYYYKVAGVNSSGEGPNSSSANVATHVTNASGQSYTYGCTNPAATNYNSAANADNGSCTLPVASSGGSIASVSATIPASSVTSTTPAVLATSAVTQPTSAVMTSSTASQTPISISPYTRVITIGFSGDDVTALQTFLEGKGFLVIPKGVAKGLFGSLTKKALVAYQKSVGLPMVGIFGPATRAKVEGELSVRVSVSPTAFSYDRNLGFGSSGGDVSTLQTFLEGKGFLVMPKGTAKGYFGRLTEKALAAYQESVGISSVGALGPMTRKHLNALPKE